MLLIPNSGILYKHVFLLGINFKVLGKYSLEVNDMDDILWKENGTFKEEGSERGESLWIQKEYRYEDDADDYGGRIPGPTLKGDISCKWR